MGDTIHAAHSRTFAAPSEIKNLKKVLQPRSGPHVEVIVAWQERIIRSYHFVPGQQVSIGNQKSCHILLPLTHETDWNHGFLTVGECASIHLGPEMKDCEITGAGGSKVLRETSGSVDLKQNEMFSVNFAGGNITVYVRYAVKASKPVAGPWLGLSLGEGIATMLCAGAAFLLGVYVTMSVQTPEEKAKEEKAKRVAKFLYAPPASGAQSATRTGGSQRISEKSGASAATVKKDVSKLGVLGVFGANGLRKKMDEASSGEGTLQGLGEKATGGVGENQNLSGDYIGRAFENANGQGNAAIGIGGVGTKGQGIANGKAGDLNGRKSHAIKLGDETEKFDGNIDKEAIRRVIAENIGQVRACYENALLKDPDLAGKLILEWQIEPDGRPINAKVKRSSLNAPGVANCVISRLLTWKFPKPPPGVIGMVDYPFSFESSSQLNGG